MPPAACESAPPLAAQELRKEANRSQKSHWHKPTERARGVRNQLPKWAVWSERPLQPRAQAKLTPSLSPCRNVDRGLARHGGSPERTLLPCPQDETISCSQPPAALTVLQPPGHRAPHPSPTSHPGPRSVADSHARSVGARLGVRVQLGSLLSLTASCLSDRESSRQSRGEEGLPAQADVLGSALTLPPEDTGSGKPPHSRRRE